MAVLSDKAYHVSKCYVHTNLWSADLDHIFREKGRVVIAELHRVGPFRGTVIQADEEQVEVLVDEEEGNKHFCTV